MGVRDVPVDDIDTVRQLMDFLQGETPEGFRLSDQPDLDKDTAFSVIYVLQEKFELITDNFEKCDNCGRIFETGYDEQIVEKADLRDPERYPDLEDIPEFWGIFCGSSCMRKSARDFREKDGEGDSLNG